MTQEASQLEYKIIRRPKRRTVCIKVSCDNDVEVLAPNWVSRDELDLFVREKERWIRKTIEKNNQKRQSKKQYIEGETFPYLGKTYSLQLGEGPEDIIEIRDTTLVIQTGEMDLTKEKIQEQLQAWYRKRAEDVIIDRVYLYAAEIGVKPNKVRVKNIKSRWASCSTKGNLNFSLKLIQVPLEILDYVIVHELCHLTHMNHAPRFWQKVSKYIPDYKARRKWLRDNQGRLVF